MFPRVVWCAFSFHIKYCCGWVQSNWTTNPWFSSNIIIYFPSVDAFRLELAFALIFYVDLYKYIYIYICLKNHQAIGERVFSYRTYTSICCVVLRLPTLRSPWLQWTGVFCSKPDNWCGNGRRVTQITSGADALGAWGQTGANTANFVRSSRQSEGLLGAQCHLPMLGPFGKVPDRVTGAIFHALVQCVAPRGSQLYQIQNPTGQLIAGASVFFLLLLPWDLSATSSQAFSPSPKFSGRLHVFSEPIFAKLHSGACELSQIPLPALKDSKPEKSSLLLCLSPLALSHSSSDLPFSFHLIP